MSWMSDRFARLRGVPRQQGAHVRGPALPEPRTEPGRPPALPDLSPEVLPARVATSRVLVAAHDDDVRFMLARRCEMSDHLDVVADTKEPVSSLRAAFRLRPEVIVVQVQSAKETEVELITALKELSPTSKIFVYSTLPGGAAVSAAMTAGADRYALAGAPLTILMREIEDLAASRSTPLTR